MFQNRTPLGRLLIEKKLITPEQLEVALKKQQESGELLGMTLITLGFLEEESVFIPILASQLGVDFVNLKQLTIDKDIIARLPAKFAVYYKVVPVTFADNTLTIATAHPLKVDVIDGIGMVVPSKIKTALAGEKDIVEAIHKYYGVGAETIDQIIGTAAAEAQPRHRVENIAEIDSEASIGKFINQILLEAYNRRATDIHIEPYERELKIRYRVD